MREYNDSRAATPQHCTAYQTHNNLSLKNAPWPCALLPAPPRTRPPPHPPPAPAPSLSSTAQLAELPRDLHKTVHERLLTYSRRPTFG